MDCQDQSDEVGCRSPVIVVSPPPRVSVDVGMTFVINCTAVGVPTPQIVWRLNWGHVPDKCQQTSSPIEGGGGRAFGEIRCPSAEALDQGAYSCEAINIKGSCFAGSAGCGQPGQDAQVVIVGAPDVCPSGTFNSMAASPADCVPCFCSGLTRRCSSASDLYLTEIPVPNSGYVLVTAPISGRADAIITPVRASVAISSTRRGTI